MNKNCRNKISYPLLAVVFKFMEIDKKTRYYGTDVPLFYAEIHLIKAIKENEGIHITGLAQYLEVTKGAVSQMLMKLEKKGFVVKEKDLGNQSRFLLKLTPKGETAHLNHMRLHQEFDETINDLLKDQDQANLEFLHHFLARLNEKMERYEEQDRPFKL
jgi:DNA-binding MarR family transcriptional regulator